MFQHYWIKICLLWHPVFSLFMVLNFVTYVWYSTGKNSSAEVTWLHGYCTKMNRTVMGCLGKLVPLKARLGFFLSLFSQEVSFGKGFSENLLLPLLRTATCLFQLVLVVCSYAVILHKLYIWGFSILYVISKKSHHYVSFQGFVLLTKFIKWDLVSSCRYEPQNEITRLK